MKQTYLKVVILVFVFVFGVMTTSQGQVNLSQAVNHNHTTLNSDGTVKRVIIKTKNPETLKLLYTKGFDFTCGSKGVSTGVQLDLNENEINILKELNIPHQITIDNLTKYISERNNRNLPQAKTELKRLKSISQGKSPSPLANLGQTTRSFSQSSESIPSAIQYDECSEVDWTPQNFTLGSMGGAYNYQEILDQLTLMQQMYPNIISVAKDASPTNQKTHGYTGTNPDIAPQTMWYVKISDNPDTDEAGEPQSLITGAAHAREVSSVMNIIYYMWYILENYNVDPLITNMIDNQELYFIPVINPDGYIYNGIQAPNGGGNQRKNLRPGTGNGQYTQGVDLNRNSPYYWGIDDAGSSPSVISGTYRGPSPASEPETQIIADFVQSKDLKVAINHHSGLNSIVTSSYNGSTSAAPSGREDEFQELMQNVTHYNRYIHGSAPNTLYPANGDFNDWMLGGPPVTTNPSGGGSYTNSGSGKNIIAFTPENGDEFAPDPTHIVPVAKRALRMNLITSLSAGSYAQLHDLTNTDINGLNSTLDFAVEYIGQTLDDLTLTVNPVSSNINSITALPLNSLSNMSKLEQREVSLPITLHGSIQPNELIEYEVTLSNSNYDIYKAVFRKYYNPTILIDADGISNWTGNWVNYTNGYNGSTNAISIVSSGSYGDNQVRTTTLNTPQNFDSSEGYVIQFNAFWDIERNFDLVQLEASTDGTNWTAICGKYNKPAAPTSVNNHFNSTKGGPNNPSNHQESNGTYVYDGDQIVNGVNKWIREEIFIDFENNTTLLGQTGVQLRFRFDSDGSNIRDGYNTDFTGFIFDDFKILALDAYTPELCTETAISSFPYNESFESGLGVWSQDQGDDGEWSRNSRGTPSGSTGPNGANDGTFYLYTEATEDPDAPGENLGNNATAILTSPCFDLSNASSATFNFDYHMFGNNMGNLIVEVLDDENFTWTPLFTQNGNTGATQNQWSSESAALTPYLNKTIKIRFVGTTGNGFSSDMAIDNIELLATIEDPDTVPPTAVCRNITASLGADGTVTILATQIDNGSTDDGTIASLTLDVDTFDCSNVGVNTVTLTVTDTGNNSDTCTATVTIEPYTTAPDGLVASTVGSTSATLSWNETASSMYTIRFRESGTTDYTTINTTINSIDLTTLEVDKTYEAQVKATCATGGDSPYSANITFTTQLIYCTSEGSTEFANGITRVILEGIDNPSGPEPAYSDFTIATATLARGSSHNLLVHLNTLGGNSHITTVWIDWNRNGDLTDAGESYNLGTDINKNDQPSENSPLVIVVPIDATLGNARMRVSNKFNGVSTPCEVGFYGEVEDYTITIEPADYIYDAGAWTPQDPSGIASSNDNIEVRSGAPTLSANTVVNNVTILAGATLDLAATTLDVNGDLTNAGDISGASGTLLMTGSSPQEIAGNALEIANLVIDNSDTIQGVTLSTALSINKLLTLTDGTLNTGDTLTLLSNATRTAMIDVITGGTISGNVTTERYIPARRAFRLLSSPVTTVTSINANWQEGVHNTGTSFPTDNMNPNPGYGTHISGSVTGESGFDATASGNGSIFKLDNALQSWQDVTNTDVTTLTAGEPIRLLVRGDRSVNITSNAATPTATTLRATGTIATSPVSFSGSTLNHNAGAFNFIGNPYQASININTTLASSTNVRTGEVWVWDATLGARGQYVTVLLDGSGSSNGANSKNYHYIQPGQAIFTATDATVTDSSTQIVFNEIDKVTGNEVPLYSNSSNAIATSPHLIGRLYRSEHYGEDAGLQDNFVILYNDRYSNDVTPEDVSKFFNIDENMGVLRDGGLLSVDKVAMPTEDDQIQLYNALYRASDYTLDLELYGLTDIETYLKDNHTGVTTLLEEGLNTISFSVDSNMETSVDTKRFEIIYQREVLSTTAEEAVDFAMYPNPITNGRLTITSTAFSGSKVDVVITNLLGQTIMTKEASFNGNKTVIDNLNQLSSGMYILSIENKEIKISHKIVIQ
ncbi:M14 family zinc carboxypeptidase [Dokdonia sp. R86516]|uniref:M14 family zinc carboxypeptidase n=1 Tax=Dokdonia sp. R86516 TaxID=3093856 RepID=UPI0037CC28F1